MRRLWILAIALSMSTSAQAQPAVDSVEVFYAAGNYVSVVRLLAPVETPRSRRCLLLGWSYYRLGNMPQARDTFSGGLDRSPSNLDLKNGLAFTQYRLGEAAAAEQLFRSVLASNPERFESLSGLAFVLYTSQRFEEALPLFDEMLRSGRAPENTEHQLVTSVDGWLSAWSEAGHTPAEMVAAGWVLADAGNDRSAVEVFRWVVVLDPFHPGARLGLGTLGPRFGLEEEALLSLHGLLRENPNDLEARVALTELHLDAGRRKDAQHQLDLFIESAPADPRAKILRREIKEAGGE
jgi:tetratricopeptide (TPR) repeat protein